MLWSKETIEIELGYMAERKSAIFHDSCIEM